MEWINKINRIEIGKEIYWYNVLIGNIAVIKSVTDKKTGLLNIKTNEIIGDMDGYYTIYDEACKLYFQIKRKQEFVKTSDQPSLKTIRIYDALNENMIVDDWEIVGTYAKKYYKDYYDIVALKSPIDGKVHLFDKFTFRKSTDIFDMALDNVEKIYDDANDDRNIYLVCTMNGKKGLYCRDIWYKTAGLETKIEFDSIEKLPNIIVYTKEKEKYFVCTEKRGIGVTFIEHRKNGKVSELFETIKIDENDDDIVYCKKGNTTYVYDAQLQELLLKLEDCDDIHLESMIHEEYPSHYMEYFFLIKQGEKFGLVGSMINDEIKKSSGLKPKVTVHLESIYTSIKHGKGPRNGTFYLEQNGKFGLFIGDSRHSEVVAPNSNCNDISYLGDCYYAFHTGEYCDIGKISSHVPYQSVVSHCKIEKKWPGALIYKKNNLFGVIVFSSHFHSSAVIPALYSKILYRYYRYFLLEENGKKGIMFYEKMIIPIGYADIKIRGYFTFGNIACESDLERIYCALKKETGEYMLAKIHDYSFKCETEFYKHLFKKIEFFKDIMVLRDENGLYIYDYNEQLLKTFSSSVSFNVFVESNENQNKDCFYCIDGVYYYYKDGKFLEAFAEEHDFYITACESDTNLFETKSLWEQEYDAFCNFADSKEDVGLENTLIKTDENTLIKTAENKSIKGKIFSLVLRRANK